MSQLKNLTTADFSKTLQSHNLVVVDFWAEWCQPCKSFSKVVEQVGEKYPDVLFANVDIDAEKELAQDFQIISVPFVMIVRNQTVVYAAAGLLSAGGLTKLIDDALALKPEQLK